MQIFEEQERARRRTSWLIALFCLGVLLIAVIMAYAAIITASSGFSDVLALAGWPQLRDNALLGLGTAAITLLVIGGASAFRIAELSQGTATIAKAMGAQRVPLAPRPSDTLRLRNIAEELAIAAGVPVPDLYVLDDQTINAFVSGWSQDDATLVVTQGALDKLNRAELQGVVAHEFGHLLHGDVRTNTLLVGLLFGVLFLGMAGRHLLSSLNNRWRARNGAPVAVFAVLLIVLGSGGGLLARLLQAAVSRQREFHADAAGAQFTRDPEALAGALQRIYSEGSALRSPETAQVSHMLFASGIRTSLFASHPPLRERISRLRGGRPVMPLDLPTHDGERAVAARIVHQAGRLAEPDIAAAQTLREALPSEIIDNDPSATASAWLKLLQTPDSLPPAQWLAALDSSLPALRELSGSESQTFVSGIAKLEVRNPLQTSLAAMLISQLADRRSGRARVPSLSLRELRNDLIFLVATIARQGHNDTADIRRAFARGLNWLFPTDAIPYQAAQARDITQWRQLLDRIGRLRAADRQLVLEALVASALHDQHIADEEYALLRILSAALHSPLPPRIQGLSDTADRLG